MIYLNRFGRSLHSTLVAVAFGFFLPNDDVQAIGSSTTAAVSLDTVYITCSSACRLDQLAARKSTLIKLFGFGLQNDLTFGSGWASFESDSEKYFLSVFNKTYIPELYGSTPRQKIPTNPSKNRPAKRSRQNLHRQHRQKRSPVSLS